MTIQLLFLVLAALIPAQGFAAAYEVVAEFERPGQQPMSRLVYHAGSGAYFGTTNAGGAHGLGTIFKLVPGGSPVTLVSFTGTSGAAKGAEPDAGLVLGTGGKLYGTTAKGGAGNYGTIFSITAAGVFSTEIEFTGDAGAYKGAVPNELIFDNGALYGTTQAGGANDCGVFFRLGPGLLGLELLESYITLDFTGTAGGLKGTMPIGPLAISGNSFFGVAQMGGAGNVGTVYRINVANLLGIWSASVGWVTDFPGGGSKGMYPVGGLAVHSNGSYYGLTGVGGSNDSGTCFKIPATGGGPSGTNLQVVYHFDDFNDGTPFGTLLMAPDPSFPAVPAFYGVTAIGGVEGFGTVFKITPGGAYTTLVNFTGLDGAVPGDFALAGLVVGPGGQFVGTTSGGGATQNGTIFEVTSAGVHTLLSEFTNAQGWEPAGVPAFNGAGEIYVPMAQGGGQGGGTLVKVSGGVTSVLATFNEEIGTEPDGGLLGVNGDFYGATSGGGISARGAAIRYNAAGVLENVASMNITGGSLPEGVLTLAPDGFLYGVAREGGSAGKGAIVRIHPSGGRTTILSFTGTAGGAPGARPRAPLALGVDGNLYGATEQGGTDNVGTIFRVTTGGTHALLKEFTSSGPRTPIGGLTMDGSGLFCGTTAFGGATNNGTIFRITSGGGFSVLAEFTGAGGAARGAQPLGALLIDVDDSLYGITAQSGAQGGGTIFRVKSDGAVETLYDFTGTGGAAPGFAPQGGLTFGPDGTIYGCTEQGGPRGGGVIFRVKDLGPTASTGVCSYAGLIATVHGRAGTGGLATDVWFEVALLPELLPISIQLPAQVTVVNGVIHFSNPLPLINLGNLVHYRACAENVNGLSRGIIRTVTALTPLQAWKSEFLGDSNASDLGDHDFDGRVNLVEYGMLKNPAQPDGPMHAPPQLKTYPEGVRLALFLQRDPARADVTIQVQAASSLNGPWATVATSVNGAPFTGPGYVTGDSNTAGIKTVEIRDVPPANAESRVMRVHITH